jgi:hypothetical protein
VQGGGISHPHLFASEHSYLYLLLNLFGSALLAVLVFISRQWGLLLLEEAWALMALWGIITRMSATLRATSSRRDALPQQEQQRVHHRESHSMALHKVVLCHDISQEEW